MWIAVHDWARALFPFSPVLEFLREEETGAPIFFPLCGLSVLSENRRMFCGVLGTRSWAVTDRDACRHRRLPGWLVNTLSTTHSCRDTSPGGLFCPNCRVISGRVAKLWRNVLMWWCHILGDGTVLLGPESEATLPGSSLKGVGEGRVHPHASWWEAAVEAGNGQLDDRDAQGSGHWSCLGLGPWATRTGGMRWPCHSLVYLIF